MTLKRTGMLPTMEEPRNEELSAKLAELREARHRRMDWGKQETDRQAEALQIMHNNGLQRYEDDSVDPPLKAIIKKGKEKISFAGDKEEEP